MFEGVVAVTDENAHRVGLGLFGRAHGTINVGGRRQERQWQITPSHEAGMVDEAAAAGNDGRERDDIQLLPSDYNFDLLSLNFVLRKNHRCATFREPS